MPVQCELLPLQLFCSPRDLFRFIGIKLSLEIAVGLPVTRQPPHRSRRAVFPHRALRRYSPPQKDLA